jgi:hypothetical protein
MVMHAHVAVVRCRLTSFPISANVGGVEGAR